MADIIELFNRLESNQPDVVEDVKKIIHDIFNSTKESYMVYGLFDYYLTTSSIRAVEILAGVREPHDKHIFDKVSESMRGSTKLQALTFLGHVIRRHPTWVYKITNHSLFKDILKLLKVETDILPLMSALLVIIVLLPMIPALLGPHLQEIFEVFSRLAAWNTNNPNKLPAEHLLHLQVSLYFLFHRLYGMYPCNFLAYLRSQYSQRDNLVIFSHTIKPMLDTVKMHPLLVTATKDAETASARWKNMEDHDVLMECAKFALDPQERTLDSLSSSLRPRGSFEHPENSVLKQNPALTALNVLPPSVENEFWSPSACFGLATPPPQESAPTSIPQTPNSQGHVANTPLPTSEGTSPPEAAVEATPETTPVKDIRHMIGRVPPTNSSVVRALNSFGTGRWQVLTSNTSTPSQSQPSSPMRKELSPFRFPSDSMPTVENHDSALSYLEQRDTAISQKLIFRMQQDRMQVAAESAVADGKHTAVSTADGVMSPHTEHSSPTLKNGFRFELEEDQEVLEIVRQGEHLTIGTQSKAVERECDSVLEDVPPSSGHVGEYEECGQEGGAECAAGGLHMPSSRSMMDLVRRVRLQQLQRRGAGQHRLRFYSQSLAQEGSVDDVEGYSVLSGNGETQVRRANSCPEMEKGPVGSTSSVRETPDERDELTEVENHSLQHAVSIGTQTLERWVPMPYEHLFYGVVEPHEGDEAPEPQTQSQTAVPHTLHHNDPAASTYSLIDKYIESMQLQCEARKGRSQGLEAELKTLKEQLVLFNIQLHFERHRREIHAERNRRLLGKSRTNRALEEYNIALKEQLSLLQKDKENLRNQLEIFKSEAKEKEESLQDSINYWQAKFNVVQKEIKSLKTEHKLMEEELKQSQEKNAAIVKEREEAESRLLSLQHEMQQVAREASVGAALRLELERAQRELVLMGELQQRYRLLTSVPPPASGEDALQLACSSYSQEIHDIRETLEIRTSTLDATRSRLVELENLLTKKEALISDQKRTLKQVREESASKLSAVESKYNSQRSINQKLEELVLKLQHQVGLQDAHRGGGKKTHTSQSESSEPLSFSESLGCPDPSSLSAMMAAQALEVKNLQLIVENYETTSQQQEEEQPEQEQSDDKLVTEEG